MTNQTVPKTAKLTFGDQEIELPVMVGSEGEVALDIRQLRAKTGAITYDPGLGNTGACQSKITFLDGELGVLRYGLPTHYAGAWETMFTDNTYSRDMVTGIIVQLVYLVVFGGLAVAYFRRKDIRS